MRAERHNEMSKRRRNEIQMRKEKMQYEYNGVIFGEPGEGNGDNEFTKRSRRNTCDCSSGVRFQRYWA